MAEAVVCRHRYEKLVAIDYRGVAHGRPGHQFMEDYTNVFMCALCGHGRLSAFSHDCFAPPGEEDWDMWWHWNIDAADIARLKEGMAHCPAWLDARCACAAHRSLRRRSGGVQKTEVWVRCTGTGAPEFVESPPRKPAPPPRQRPWSNPGAPWATQ